MAGVKDVDGGNGSIDYRRTPTYQEIVREHPDANCVFDEKTGTITWTEKTGGIFSSGTKSGSVRLSADETKPSDKEQLKMIMEQMDEINTQRFVEEGFLTDNEKKKYVEFNIKTYEEVTGKTVTPGDLKLWFGLKDGALNGSNDGSFYFKDRSDTPRNMDDYPLSVVYHGGDKVKINRDFMYEVKNYEDNK